MKVLSYFGKEQKIYYEKLDNGLDTYVIPNQKKGNYYLEIVVRYGSSIKEFKPLNSKEYLKLPLGVAHFLEHKIFDDENTDSFAFFSKSGTYINAGTTYFSTRYYISGKKNFKKNLDYLLTMIYTPYFTDARVNSEKKIIAEEIKMYDDEPMWILDDEAKRSLFYTTLNEKIAGTCETIDKITPTLLQQTYEVFYQPSNMALVATGNVNYKDILEVIKNNQAINQKLTNHPIIVKKEKEPRDIPLEYKLLTGNVVIPKLSYSFKFNLDDFPFNYQETRMYLNLVFTYLFGDTSSFNSLIKERKIAFDYLMDHVTFANIYTLTLEAESEFADIFKDEVDKAVSLYHITEDDFSRIKKIWFSINIRSLDKKEALACSIVDEIIRDGEIPNQYDLIKNLSYQGLLTIIEHLNFNYKSFILMIPNNKEK